MENEMGMGDYCLVDHSSIGFMYAFVKNNGKISVFFQNYAFSL